MRLVLGLPCFSTVLPAMQTMAPCLRTDQLRMACGRASLRPASTVALTIPSLMHVQTPDALTFFFQMLGLAIFWCPLSLLSALQPCGPFPQRALPRVYGITDHSATLTARPAPYGVPVAVCFSTDRASRVATSLIFHACQRQYPGEPSWCICRSLPKTRPPSPYRRMGRHSHYRFRGLLGVHCTFRPAWSLSYSRSPLNLSASYHVVTSIIRQGRYQPERQVLGGVRTRHRKAPFHGARLTSIKIYLDDNSCETFFFKRVCALQNFTYFVAWERCV